MEVIITSVCSAIIIFITVFYMLKAFKIAYKRNEISFQKFIFISISSIITGVIIASVFPIGYQKIFDILFN
ncbi:hypothetical protein [Neobacillus thermocopriae]|uniref:DUF1146 domain-containing protein n=1 Tax=Neobacillus thermocopriae TaxID=1215031 RepID=A0A6B3TV67_9BACI|nr:hypothetical protein [Neobacillus thermocopriae]MED3623045.1 hypothetical protein [Neobacillus thermocopriae]MED3714940.1 hypothetical protein [Neobacillus thermocopriae]NEX80348.1 hypothetical protein [Neobacillus thermocopriae]